MPGTGATGTGYVLEAMILPALRRGSYSYQKQVVVGTRPTGRPHRVDVVAMKDGQSYLVSLKWQQVSGTAEQKVPFEVICLIDTLEDSQSYDGAYLVLGGPGWTTRDFYVDGGLLPFIPRSASISILSLEQFIARANRGDL